MRPIAAPREAAIPWTTVSRSAHPSKFRSTNATSASTAAAASGPSASKEIEAAAHVEPVVAVANRLVGRGSA
jgi:hypothetical protein